MGDAGVLLESVGVCAPKKWHSSVRNILSPPYLPRLNHHGEAPIHIAARRGHSRFISILIKHGVDINHPNLQRETPLHLAVMNGEVDCVCLLLDAGCALDLLDLDGSTPIHVACRSWDSPVQSDIISAIISRKPSLTAARDGRACTPLILFARLQHDKDVFREVLPVLIDAGADLEAVSDNGVTPLLEAAEENNFCGMRYLFAAGGRVTGDQRNILHVTAKHSGFRVMDCLHALDLSSLHDFHLARDKHGDTPWDSWRIFMTLETEWLADIRRPSKRDARAFIRLFRKIRDQSLQRDIDTLVSVLEPLRDESANTAMTRLRPLTQRKELRGLDQEAETFRVVGIQIQQGMWEAAVESVEENIEVYQEEMNSSPWEMESWWDEWPDLIDYSDARQYHGTESEEYPGDGTEDAESDYDDDYDSGSDSAGDPSDDPDADSDADSES